MFRIKAFMGMIIFRIMVILGKEEGDVDCEVAQGALTECEANLGSF